MAYLDVDALRVKTIEIADQFHARTAQLDGWIPTASKKQLLGEIIFILANNHKANKPF